STLVQMVAGGAAVTLLPTLAVATEARRAGLRVRPMASPKARRTIALAWRRRSPLGPALREIALVLRDAFPSPSPAVSRPRAIRSTRARSARQARQAR